MAWYLKKQDGAVFGPAGLTVMREWAASGRIAPEDQVSTDQAQWKAAPDEPLLEMSWKIMMEDGTSYGPVHLEALKELLLDNSLLPQTQLLNTTTGVECSLAEAIMPLLLGSYRDMAETLATLQDRTKASQAAEETPPAAADAANGPAATENWQNAFRESDRLERAAQKWKQLYEEERKSGQEQIAELREKIRAMTQEDFAVQSALEHARRELAQLKKIQEQFQQSMEQTEPEKNLWLMFTDLTRSFDLLSMQFMGKMDEIKTLRDLLGHAQSDAESRIQHMETQWQREREAAAVTAKRLAELEDTHLQIIRAFREMNDHYIRMREQAKPGGEAVPLTPKAGASPQAPGPKRSGPRIRLR